MGAVVTSNGTLSVAICNTVKKRNSHQHLVYPGTTYLRGCERYAGSSMIVTSLNIVVFALNTSVIVLWFSQSMHSLTLV